MNLFTRNFLIATPILMCCSLSFAEPARIDDRIIKFRPSKSKFFESTGYRKINNEFSKFTEAANVEHIPTGAKARINAKITASVSRAAVLSGVGKLVRQGAKFSTRAVPYVGTALLAHDVYETFKEDIQARGYQYDTETDKFVKGYEYSNCLWYEDERRINRTYGCYGVDSSIMRLMSDYSRFPEVKELMESQMERLARPYWEKLRNRPDMYYFKNYNFKRCYFGLNGGDCLVAKGDDGRTFISFSLQGNSKYKEEMDAKKLEEILSLKVDANPDKYIKATGYPGYSEKVEVAPGTKVNMGPVTDRNGNPVQVVATFGRDSQGNTTVDVQVIPRPDLTPGSAEAPNAQPLPEVSPAENPANNPNSNENPGTSPNTEPDPDLNPDANPDTDGQPGTRPDSPAVPGRTNGRDGEDGGLLCKFFPDILACDRLPEPNPAEDLNLPSETVNVEFQKSGIFQNSAQCPAPVTFTVTVLDSSRQFAFSFENACTIAERLRYMLLALAWAVAAFFCIRTVSREV